MSEHADGMSEGAGRPGAPGNSEPGPHDTRDDKHPSLTTEVRRRRADQEFFLRLRDAIQQNYRALERLGT